MPRKRRTFEEEIADIQEQRKKLNEREKKIKAQHSRDEQKKRTKHLIEIGGVVYSVLGRSFKEGDIERLTAYLKQQDMRGEWFSKAMNREDPVHLSNKINSTTEIENSN